MLDEIRADLALLHRKQDAVLLALHHILTKVSPMASSDDIRAALNANGDKLIKAGAAAAALIASHESATSIGDDILTDVQGQGAAIDALTAKMAAAVPAPAAEEAAPEAPAEAEQAQPVVSLTPAQ